MTRSITVLWGMILGAIAALALLAQLWIGQRDQAASERVTEILQARLVPIDDLIRGVMQDYSITLQRSLNDCELGEAMECFEATRSPLVQALVVVNEDSYLRYPTSLEQLDTNSRTLVDEARQLLEEQSDPRPAAARTLNGNPQQSNLMPSKTSYLNAVVSSLKRQEEPQAAGRNARGRLGQAVDAQTTPGQVPLQQQLEQGEVAQQSLPPQPSVLGNDGATGMQQSDGRLGAELEEAEPNNAIDSGQNYGWITWYHRRGLVIGFWWHQADRWKAIAILPRARWMADLVSALPDSGSTSSPDARDSIKRTDSDPGGSVQQLVDVEGTVIYQWGDAPQAQWEAITASPPTAELAVSSPLEGWRLRVYASDQLATRLAGDTLVAPIWLAVSAISLALILGGVLISVNFNRQLRLAASRVSFVNQVSHELRTPLTNICMYADLLANDLEADGESSSKVERVNVIQNESRRLNRLIANVLEFARSSSKPKPMNRSAAVLDELVEEVVAMFRPKLDELGFEVQLELDTPTPREFDRDVVEQILVNLIGNAEKYAADGKYLLIQTYGNAESANIVVSDHGPGIPERMSERVFAPFVRLSDRLDAPAGTGIGLTIVRDLANRHGGDCVVAKVDQGASLRCTLDAPLTA